MNRVTDIPDSLLISFYFSGLKLNLQRELLVPKPTTLGDAFSLAHLTKARLEDKSAPTSVTVTKPISNVGNQRQSSPRLWELQRRPGWRGHGWGDDGFKWGVQEASAFEELKHQFSVTPVLSLPDFNEVFVVEANASANGIGAVFDLFF
ncbi:retrotransposon-related protein [Tanacetum coccineum]